MSPPVLLRNSWFRIRTCLLYRSDRRVGNRSSISYRSGVAAVIRTCLLDRSDNAVVIRLSRLECSNLFVFLIILRP
jgi:hypothetical protein